MNIKKALQKVPFIPYWEEIRSLKNLFPLPFYLVGGTVRDLLLDRPVSDLDIAVPEQAMAIARHFARVVGGAFVPLDWKSETARVVLPHTVFDFSSMKGKTIEDDLAKRDFTINALAVEIRPSDQLMEKMIDPFNGFRDLSAKRLVPCSDTIFLDDPLRILRAYRLAAVLELTMADSLPRLIKRDCAQLTRTSAERIRDELFMILSREKSEDILRHMDTMGILSILFPEIDPMRKTAQNRYHHLDVWGHSLCALKHLEHIINNLPLNFNQYGDQVRAHLESRLVQGRPIKALVKLATLFHDVGKSETSLKDDQGRIHFYGHDKAGSVRIRNIAQRLKLSRREVDLLGKLVLHHMRPHHLLTVKTPSLRSINRFFRNTAGQFWSLFCMYYADLLAKEGPESDKKEFTRVRDRLLSILSTYYRQIRPKEIDKPLLTGRDLIEQLDLTPGPLFREILEAVHEAHVEGTIAGKEDAVEFVKKLLGN